ncbi:hypothetical protein AB5J72_24330 [Streptomyces sp. CG1]|uniref:hypothetical protein n=1 Tax=Streptomyces sp. CG1 TaxID=1287523 RepID=UPI0034E19E6C
MVQAIGQDSAHQEQPGGAAPAHATDQAVLMGTALAAAFLVNNESSNWDFSDFMVGSALVLILAAYYRPQRPRQRWERQLKAGAFASVAALCLCVMLGYPESLMFGDHTTDTRLVPIGWCVFTAALYLLHFVQHGSGGVTRRLTGLHGIGRLSRILVRGR